MIYHNYINPADAKPGDFMFCQNGSENTGLNLCLLIVNQHEINIWHKVTTFYYCDHESDIVDGKPTPALIARFTGGGGKRFGVDECAIIKVPGKILEISGVKKFENHYYFGIADWCQKWNGEYFREYSYYTEEQAEAERARLIEWLEGA